MKTTKLLILIAIIAVLGTATLAHAQVFETRGEVVKSPYTRESDNGFGDKWSPYISVAGLTALRNFGTVNAVVDGNSEELNMKTPAILQTQAGVYVSSNGQPMHARLSVGYIYGQATSDIGNSAMNIVSIEGMGFYQIENHRLGGGVHTPVFARINASNLGGETYDLGRPIGYVGEYGYFVSSMSTWLFLRGQMTKYSVPKKARQYFGSEFRDNSVGVGLSFQFL